MQRGGCSQVPNRLPRAVQVAQGSNSIALQGPRAAWRGRRKGPREGGQFSQLPAQPEPESTPTLHSLVGRSGSLTEVNSRKGTLGTPTQALDITPPFPLAATSCYHPKNPRSHPSPQFWLPSFAAHFPLLSSLYPCLGRSRMASGPLLFIPRTWVRSGGFVF